MIPSKEALEKAILSWQMKRLGVAGDDYQEVMKVAPHRQLETLLKWKKKNDPNSAVEGITRGMVMGMAHEIEKGRNSTVALESALLSMFIMGWEMRDEFPTPVKKKGK